MVALPRGTTDKVLDKLWPQPNPYLVDPTGWIRKQLGIELWSKQREVAEAVRDHQHVCVQSCHSSGKSLEAAALVCWWLAVHPVGEAFAVTTAPTQPQVNAILWRYIRRLHRKAGLPGRTTLDAHWYMGADEMVAYGRKPADYVDTAEAMQAFQGIHARYVLVILDEACGIPKWLYDATDSLATNTHARVLAIGNPDDPASHFNEVCKPGSGWFNMRISAFDTPNFTGEEVSETVKEELVSPEWVEARKRRWGESSPLYQSKVLGLFPDVSEDTLIPPLWIRQAQERDLSARAVKKKGRFGVDVASTGSDLSAVYRDRGGMVRHEWSGNEPDTMKFAGRVKNVMLADTPAVCDVIGVGQGLYNRLREQGLPAVPFNASERSSDPERFKNMRAEAYWSLREDFEEGRIDLDPDDDDVAAQLGSIKWWTDSSGRIVIEPKKEQRRRLGVSPDFADAVMMCRVGKGAARYTRTTNTEDLTADLLTREM